MAKWDIQNGFSGSSTAARERSGIAAIYSHRHQRNYAGWWHQARYKWDGWTLHHILALHQTRQETLQSTLVKQKIGTLPKHKFEHWAGMETAWVNMTSSTMSSRCMLMPSSRALYQQQRDRSSMLHRGSCMEYTTYFPQARTMPRPHLSKKLHKGEDTFETTKCMLGFDFDGVNKTIRLEEDKRVFPILAILHQCTQGTTKAKRGISLQNSNWSRQNGTRLHGTLGELQATQPVQRDHTEATIGSFYLHQEGVKSC